MIVISSATHNTHSVILTAISALISSLSLERNDTKQQSVEKFEANEDKLQLRYDPRENN